MMEVLKILLDSGKDSDLEHVKRLVRARPELARQRLPSGDTLMHHALTPAAATTLLELGVPCDWHNYGGETPLVLALAGNSEDVARVLINAGANVNARDWEETPCIGLARESATIGLMVARGASLERRDFQGRTALHRAVLGPEPGTAVKRIAAQLLALGADVDARDADGNTPLHLAAERGGRCGLAAIRLLMQAGADPHVRNYAGRGAHALARTRVQRQLMEARRPLAARALLRLRESSVRSN